MTQVIVRGMARSFVALALASLLAALCCTASAQTVGFGELAGTGLPEVQPVLGFLEVTQTLEL